MTTLNELRTLAASRAAELGAEFVGSEHLFLAWLEVGGEAPLAIVRAAGLDPDTFRRMLAERPPRSVRVTPAAAPAQEGAPAPDTLPPAEGSASASSPEGAVPLDAIPTERHWSSHARRALTAAEALATQAGRDATGDDVGWVLIREPRGAIARALATHQLKPSQLRGILAPKGGKGRGPGAGAAPAAAAASSPGSAIPAEPKADGRSPRGEPPRRDAVPRPERDGGRAKGKAAGQTVREAPQRRRGRDPEIDDIPEAKPPERPRLVPAPPPVRPVRRQRWWRKVPATTPLLVAVPLAIWLHLIGASVVGVFAAIVIGLIPLAAWMGHATTQIADRSGPALGGLLNAAFGNAAELIIGFVALRAGYGELVRASIAGSILGNLLLLLGLALVTGGLRRPVLTFNRTAAGMAAVMLSLAVAGMIFPALVQMAHPGALAPEHVSIGVAVILLLTYLLSLIFVFGSHRPFFATAPRGSDDDGRWPIWLAVGVLAVAAALVGFESEVLVGVIEPVTRALGMSPVFLGLILIPMVGNAAEHATAISAARQG